jgi:hypothetical protein
MPKVTYQNQNRHILRAEHRAGHERAGNGDRYIESCDGLNLNLSVTAEWAETDEQWAFLESKGCYEAQGYLYDRLCRRTIFSDFYQDAQL